MLNLNKEGKKTCTLFNTGFTQFMRFQEKCLQLVSYVQQHISVLFQTQHHYIGLQCNYTTSLFAHTIVKFS